MRFLKIDPYSKPKCYILYCIITKTEQKFSKFKFFFHTLVLFFFHSPNILFTEPTTDVNQKVFQTKPKYSCGNIFPSKQRNTICWRRQYWLMFILQNPQIQQNGSYITYWFYFYSFYPFFNTNLFVSFDYSFKVSLCCGRDADILQELNESQTPTNHDNSHYCTITCIQRSSCDVT